MNEKLLQLWDLWYPRAGATGIPFARGRMDPTAVLYVHAAPDVLNVEVRMTDGTLVATGQNLKRSLEHYSPIMKLAISGDQIAREDLWPSAEDMGNPVILPGGEVAILKTWWNAPDFKEWRWQVEFYNCTR